MCRIAWRVHDMEKASARGASDCFIPDLVKIGGLDGWMRTAAHGMPQSSHLCPEVSGHRLAVSPTCHWLELVDWTAPIPEEPVQVDPCTLTAASAPGHGMRIDHDAVERPAA